MFNFRKYILRIIILLIAILSFCFFLREELIKSFMHNVELNSLIIFMFFTGVVIAINNIITLNKENIWLIDFIKEKRNIKTYKPKLLSDFVELKHDDLFL